MWVSGNGLKLSGMTRSRRKLTAVMFTDIVGYSAMVNDDDRRA